MNNDKYFMILSDIVPYLRSLINYDHCTTNIQVTTIVCRYIYIIIQFEAVQTHDDIQTY